jgi:hypothetical protein
MKLRWEERDGGWWAYSGELLVGMTGEFSDFVLAREPGHATHWWKVDAVHMKWIGKGRGEVSSIAAGKRGVETAWNRWLEHAGLAEALRASPVVLPGEKR